MAATNIDLGTAGDFAILAGSAITNTGSTAISGGINGNVGLDPTGGAAITGLTAAMVAPGIIYDNDGGGPAGSVMDAPRVLAAKNDLTAAYLQAAGLPGGVDPTAGTGELGGLTLSPGVYIIPAAVSNLTGTLILSGAGNYIFQFASTLITSSGSIVSLINGATADRIYWQVTSSATLGTTTNFRGTILALTSITLNTGATIGTVGGLPGGRALARNGAVTMDANQINAPVPATSNPTITVDYTPQFPGNHRICYGQTNPIIDPQCCILDTTVSTIGVPKSFTFEVASAPCGSISPVTYPSTYEGYVQPTCVPEGSPSFRIGWTVSYGI